MATGEMTGVSAAKSTKAKNLAVFIDADNLNDPTALDHVLTTLRSMAERVLYKRAYGRSESLKVIESVLWRHGVRPVANMIVNKVTTDSALVIDAVEAVCRNDIDAVAICSGDADFVPLATWIRERGCHVFCFSLADRIFANPESFYDEVVLLELVEKIGPLTPLSPTPEVPVPVVTLASAVPVFPPPELNAGNAEAKAVREVLNAFPALRSGKPQYLSQVVAVLRERGILGKNVKTSIWFAQWTSVFQLLPIQKPNQLIYIQPRSIAPAPLQKAAVQPSKPVPKVPVRSAASPVTAVLSWPVAIGRNATPPLLAGLHGLRSVLLQLAVCRVNAADVLLAAPEMLKGQPCALSAVAGRLREKGLLRPYQSALRVLERHPGSFALQMNGKPPAVIYLR